MVAAARRMPTPSLRPSFHPASQPAPLRTHPWARVWVWVWGGGQKGGRLKSSRLASRGAVDRAPLLLLLVLVGRELRVGLRVAARAGVLGGHRGQPSTPRGPYQPTRTCPPCTAPRRPSLSAARAIYTDTPPLPPRPRPPCRRRLCSPTRSCWALPRPIGRPRHYHHY